MMKKTAKKGMQRGMQIAALTLNEGMRIFNPLIQTGKMTEAEARTAAKQLVGIVDYQWKRTEARLEQYVVTKLSRLGVVEKSARKQTTRTRSKGKKHRREKKKTTN